MNRKHLVLSCEEEEEEENNIILATKQIETLQRNEKKISFDMKIPNKSTF